MFQLVKRVIPSGQVFKGQLPLVRARYIFSKIPSSVEGCLLLLPSHFSREKRKIYQFRNRMDKNILYPIISKSKASFNIVRGKE